MNASGTSNDWSFAFDAYGRTTCARNSIVSDACSSSTSKIAYAYDALDRTTSRVKGSSTTTYAYEGRSEDPFKVVGSSTTTYAYSPYGALAQKSGTATRFFAKDPHGDIVGLVDNTTSTLKGTASYDPWGERRIPTGSETTILGFQGDLTDPETKMVDMTTRNYLPSLGRFSKRDVLFGDPLSPVSLNQFVYAGANPVTMSDPTGMCPIDRDCPPPGSFTEEEKQSWYDWQSEHPPAVPDPEPIKPPIVTFNIPLLTKSVYWSDALFNYKLTAEARFQGWGGPFAVGLRSGGVPDWIKAKTDGLLFGALKCSLSDGCGLSTGLQFKTEIGDNSFSASLYVSRSDMPNGLFKITEAYSVGMGKHGTITGTKSLDVAVRPQPLPVVQVAVGVVAIGSVILAGICIAGSGGACTVIIIGERVVEKVAA